VQRDLVRVGKSIERVLTAYQEDLLSLEQLRERMPSLRQREQALRAELQSIADQTRERTIYLRLAETLTAFLARLRVAADTLDILERQRLVRLLIKEVLVGDDTIVIRHCIPVPSAPPDGSDPPSPIRSDEPGVDRSYLLRSGSGHSALRRTSCRLLPATHPSSPRSSVSSTGVFSHSFIKCSILPSLRRRATHCINSACGILSKYRDRSASTMSVCPSLIALWTA
jgi:hypothetical protein